MMTADGDIPAELSKLQKAYELVGELSRDDLTTVYVARDRASGNEVAIKVLRATDARGREALAHYASDARLLTALEHPNIVTVHAVKWLTEDTVAVVTERLRGPTLRQILDVAGTLPVARATEVLRGLARALAWAHSSQIMHRDLRPENVIFEDRTGRVVLTDLGLARRIDGPGSSDPVADAYRAPELSDGRYPDRRSDVYSLGIVGWELLTGRRPWPDTMDPIEPGRRAPAPPPLAEVRPGLPPALVAAIEGAVQLDRDRRITDVVMFMERLTQVAPPAPDADEEPLDDGAFQPGEWLALPIPKLPQKRNAAALDREAPLEATRDVAHEIAEAGTHKSVDEPVQEPVQEPAHQAVHEAADEVVHGAVDESPRSPVVDSQPRSLSRREPPLAVKEPVPEPVPEAVREPVREPVQEQVQRSVQRPVQQQVYEAAQEPTPPAQATALTSSTLSASVDVSDQAARRPPVEGGRAALSQAGMPPEREAAPLARGDAVQTGAGTATAGFASHRLDADVRSPRSVSEPTDNRASERPADPVRERREAEVPLSAERSTEREVTRPVEQRAEREVARELDRAAGPATPDRVPLRPVQESPLPVARPASDRPASDRPVSDRPVSHRAASDQAASDQPASLVPSPASRTAPMSSPLAQGSTSPVPSRDSERLRRKKGRRSPPAGSSPRVPTQEAPSAADAPIDGGRVDVPTVGPGIAAAAAMGGVEHVRDLPTAPPGSVVNRPLKSLSAIPSDVELPPPEPVRFADLPPSSANPPVSTGSARARGGAFLEGMRGGLGSPRGSKTKSRRRSGSGDVPMPPPLQPVWDTPVEFPLPAMPDPRPVPADVSLGGAPRRRWTRRTAAIAGGAVVLLAAAITLARMERAPDTTAGLIQPEVPAGYGGGDVVLTPKAATGANSGAAGSKAARSDEPIAGRGARPATGGGGTAAAASRAAADTAQRSRAPAAAGTGEARPNARTNARTSAPAVAQPNSRASRDTPAVSGAASSGGRQPAVSRPPAAQPAPSQPAASQPATRQPAARVAAAAPSAAARPEAPTGTPGSPCESASVGDQRTCLLALVDRQDAGLNGTYGDVISAMRERANTAPNDPDPPEVQRLRAAQRAWLARRDAECRRRGRGSEGPLWASSRARCFAEFTSSRTQELSATLARLRRD